MRRARVQKAIAAGAITGVLITALLAPSGCSQEQRSAGTTTTSTASTTTSTPSGGSTTTSTSSTMPPPSVPPTSAQAAGAVAALASLLSPAALPGPIRDCAAGRDATGLDAELARTRSEGLRNAPGLVALVDACVDAATLRAALDADIGLGVGLDDDDTCVLDALTSTEAAPSIVLQVVRFETDGPRTLPGEPFRIDPNDRYAPFHATLGGRTRERCGYELHA